MARDTNQNLNFIELNLNFIELNLDFVELKLNFIELKLNYGIAYCYNRLAILCTAAPFRFF